MRLAIRLCAGALLSCAAVSASAQVTGPVDPVSTLTEDQAIDRLLARDPGVRALRTRVDEVRAAFVDRARWPNPSVTFNRESVADTSDTFYVGRQELPLSGRLGLLRDAGELAAESTDAEVRFAIAQRISELRHAFTALLLAQEQEAALREAVAELERLVNVLRTREGAGEGSTYDRMRGARALADQQHELASAGVERARARGTLATYLGTGAPPDRLVAAGLLRTDPPIPPVEALVEQALDVRPDHRARQLTSTQFETERRAAERLRVPVPTLSAGLKRSGIGGLLHNGYQVSVDLGVPLFNRGQAAAVQAQAQADRARAEAEALRIQIAADVRTAHTTVVLRRAQTEAYRQSVADTAEPLVATARIAYEEGELGILELLDATRQAVDARLRSLEAAALARRAAIDLDRAIGRER
jgi:cobalt-zinc-cadmium efflux system outer membrane protein